jgi:FlaG/FlaF family flagellin (archaellin)
LIRKKGTSLHGISPVIAVILIVAITIIMAGIVSLWVFSFLGDGNTEKNDQYFFSVTLSGSEDTITISPLNGDPLKTSIMNVYIDQQPVELPVMNITIGSNMVAPSPFDLVPGEEYNVRIVIQNELQFDQEKIAAP